ncbi:hypothetical protein DSO57_1032874 [Entomophthora muscae]|uniref:Uncharacterized protein n=1 Tax=Entomophthora muscae TaxID=34485 RepID=A0ACC2U987_9FUNG|nr:hypothetical protein DSO57_1032874 [Entomophthora muscae]
MLGFILVSAVVIWWGWNVVYSVWLSPLREIPSPLELQLLPLLFDASVARGNSHLLLHKYHLRYGPVFRIGWKKVIFVDADAAAQMFGTYKYDKGRIYDGFRYFGDNLLTLKTRAEHSARRKLVVPAFTRPKVLAMEPIIIEKGILPLLANLEDAEGSVDLLKQLHYMSWDVIGELGFGKSFEMLKSGGHPAASWMESVLKLSMACYVFPPLLKLRIPNGERLRAFSQKLIDAYSSTKHPSKTILSHFTASVDKETGQVLSKEAIFAEAHLLLFAGTETTSNSIGFFFYLLGTHPKVYKKVAAEVRANPHTGILSHDTISTTMPYLQAAIKEAMRILPVVSSTIFRTVPKDGLHAANYFIPQGTEVTVPFYSIHRSPLLWDEPDKFIPERWLDCSPLKRKIDPRCFIPFSIGPRACAGKELAKVEMLLACANILSRFDLELVTDPKSTDLDLVSLPILRPSNSSIFFKVTKLVQ